MTILLAKLLVLFTVDMKLIIFTEGREIQTKKSAINHIIQFLGSTVTECLVIPSNNIFDK